MGKHLIEVGDYDKGKLAICTWIYNKGIIIH